MLAEVGFTYGSFSHGNGTARSARRAVRLGKLWRCAFKKTGAELHERLVGKQQVCLRQLGENRAGEVRFGRFLANPRVSVEELIDGACADIGLRSCGRHVLAIQDTSEINFQRHANRVSGLGAVGNGSDLGFFVHPLLAGDADAAACLGLAHLHLWQRTQGKAPNYKHLPIEEKESARWIDTVVAGKKRLTDAAMITVVADREADIYELWDRLPDTRTHLLIRACRDRSLVTTTDQTLFAWMDAQPVQGSYRITLPATDKRSGHEALLHVRFGTVTIKKPRNCSDQSASSQLTLNVIDVVEDAATVVGDEAPIHWRLLTTHAVTTLDEARQCIGWYCLRWQIEQTFRTVKRQGLSLESSLIEHGARLEKLAVMACSAAVRVMQLTMARDGHAPRPATDTFDTDEIEVLHHVQVTLEGKTAKQKNPHPPNSLAWAAWTIARLGGWKGYASERKPGPITMLHGLQALASIHQGWTLAHESLTKDVCIR
jgi:hypothetical protein